MKKLILLSIFSILTLVAQAVIYTWNGGNGDYNDPNWSVGGGAVCCAPPSSAEIDISSGEVTLNVNRSSNAIKISGIGSLRLLSGADLITTRGTGATFADVLEIDGAGASVIVEDGAIFRLRNSNNATRGVYMHSGASFTNRGTTEVDINDANGSAIYLEDVGDTFTNNATALLELIFSSEIGILSFGTFLNAGEIEIEETLDNAIEFRGSATNNGTIEIENADGIGLATLDDFTNNSNGKIYIGSRNGIIGTIAGAGFTSQAGGTVVNRGLIKVDNFDDSIGEGVLVKITDFTNEGNIDITHVSSRYGISLVTGTLVNADCANIRSKSPFFAGNTGRLINDGNIFLDTPESSMIFATAGINGEITNNGQIEDFQGSFDLSAALFINNGLVLQPISDTYEYGEAVPNFLQGSGTEITVNGNVYLNSDGTNVIGFYKQVGNEFITNNTDAICKDTFYLSLDDGKSCPVIMKIKFENPIIPDLLNANEAMNIKTFLQGPLDVGTMLMDDDLRLAGLIPLTDPYNGSQTITDLTVLDDNGDDSIVDWVLLEISTISDPSNVFRQIPLLLQRDGDVVTAFGGIPNVALQQSCETEYYVRIRHRNHLGVAAIFEDTF